MARKYLANTKDNSHNSTITKRSSKYQLIM